MDIIIEKNIIKKCQMGDKNAFRVIVQSYQCMVFSIALKMVCCEDAAKDIVQETFIRIWLNINNYNPDKNFKTWIYTIAVRLCLDTIKKSAKRQPMPIDDIYLKNLINNQSPDKHIENKELASIIALLVGDLSPKQRVVFTLVCLENIDTQEVTQITGLSANKIKSNLYVARKKIQEQLKSKGYE